MAGGPAQTLCDAEGASGTWNRAGVILFDGGGAGGPLQRVDAGGGTPERVTTLDQARGDQRHLYPHFLADGDHFLFLARGADIENHAIMVGSLSSPASSLVIRENSRAIYDAGYMLFVRTSR